MVEKSSRKLQYAAMDPLAVIFPTSVYLALVEKFHPHSPPDLLKKTVIDEAFKQMTADEKKFALTMAKSMREFCDVIVNIGEK